MESVDVEYQETLDRTGCLVCLCISDVNTGKRKYKAKVKII